MRPDPPRPTTASTLFRLTALLGLLSAPLALTAPRQVGACGACECLEATPSTFPEDGAVDVPTNARLFVAWPDRGGPPAYRLTAAASGEVVETEVEPGGGSAGELFVVPTRELAPSTSYELTDGTARLTFMTGAGPAGEEPLQLGDVSTRAGSADLCGPSVAAVLELAVVNPDRQPVLLQLDLEGQDGPRRLYLRHRAGAIRLGSMEGGAALGCQGGADVGAVRDGQTVPGTLTALGLGGNRSPAMDLSLRFGARDAAACAASGC